MDLSSLGKAVIILGIVLIGFGGLLWLLSRMGLPFGRLPGDILIQREGLSCAIPLASMIVLSLLLTILLNVIIRLFNR